MECVLISMKREPDLIRSGSWISRIDDSSSKKSPDSQTDRPTDRPTDNSTEDDTEER
jgi:hypothetical protein